MRRWIYIFLFGLGLNLVWENLHSFLYLDYKGGPINEFILFRAALFDALFILVFIWLVDSLPLRFRYKSILLFVTGIIAAAIIEKLALAAGRWSYNELMPMIPIIKTGLTPTIQLALTVTIVYRLIGNER